MEKIKSFFKNFFDHYLPRAKHHFDLAMNGKEDLTIVLWVWGGGAYIFAFFIDKLILFVDMMFIKWVLTILMIVYFIWHIVVIRKCSPKKPEMSEEEKEEYKKDRNKRIVRKLLLKEPITKFNPSTVGIVIDLYVIVCFAEYLLK